MIIVALLVVMGNLYFEIFYIIRHNFFWIISAIGIVVGLFPLYKIDFCNIQEKIYRLKRSLRWFKRTWACGEFDFFYMFQVQKWKLEDMKKLYESDGGAICGNAWEIKDQIEHAIYYLEIIMEEDYNMKFLHPIYDESWDCSICAWKKEGFIHSGIWSPNLKCQMCTAHGMTHNKVLDLYKKQWSAHQEDIKAYFLYIAEHCEFWWD
jgi:hypothetical protein